MCVTDDVYKCYQEATDVEVWISFNLQQNVIDTALNEWKMRLFAFFAQ